MLTITDLAGLRRDPRGCCHAARQWLLYVAPGGALAGTVSWGRPDLDQVREIERAADAVLASDVAPFPLLVDVRHVDGIDPIGFAALGAFGVSRAALLSRRVRRLALVRPSGLTGVVAEGFFSIFPAPCPIRLFADPYAAIEWLGVPDQRPLVEALEPMRANVAGTHPIVLKLRAFLESSPSAPSGATVARALGLSTRTFSRQLREANVRFRRELLEARVRVAQRRMRDSDVKLTALALELGFGSAQHFSNAFREVTGRSPSAYRKQAI